MRQAKRSKDTCVYVPYVRLSVVPNALRHFICACCRDAGPLAMGDGYGATVLSRSRASQNSGPSQPITAAAATLVT